jgi:hypothetical protein
MALLHPHPIRPLKIKPTTCIQCTTPLVPLDLILELALAHLHIPGTACPRSVQDGCLRILGILGWIMEAMSSGGLFRIAWVPESYAQPGCLFIGWEVCIGTSWFGFCVGWLESVYVCPSLMLYHSIVVIDLLLKTMRVKLRIPKRKTTAVSDSLDMLIWKFLD